MCRPAPAAQHLGRDTCVFVPRHAPCLAKKTEEGFCIWHGRCRKSDWNMEDLAEQAFEWSEVDGPDPALYDGTGVPPLRKVPCTYHVQKNAVGRLIDALYSLHGRDNDGLQEWVKSQKWGMALFFIRILHVHYPASPPVSGVHGHGGPPTALRNPPDVVSEPTFP